MPRQRQAAVCRFHAEVYVTGCELLFDSCRSIQEIEVAQIEIARYIQVDLLE